MCVLIELSAWADAPSTREYAVTATASWETMPRLGNDGVSDLVVFTRRERLADGTMGKGDIWYQRLASGAPLGDAVQVTSNDTDNELNDVSGDFIVYTAYDSTSDISGRIMVYQISTTLLYGIGSALVMQEPRISGSNVVWREGGVSASMVMLYHLEWLGTTRDGDVIAGPIPPASNVDIGDRFVVWAERTNLQQDIVAYDLASDVWPNRIAVTGTPTVTESEPSTSGAWIVWQAQDNGVAASRIVARNVDTGEERVIADAGVFNYRPSIDGDLIAYESMLNGNLDVFVYRISTGETFQVTTDPADQYLNDVFLASIAYVDQRTGTSDIYITDLLIRPTANAGPAQTIHIGSLVTLDGSASSDPNGNVPLTYAWSFLSRPAGSAASLSNPTSVNPTFTPDVSGNYVIRLIVTNSVGMPSQPATVTISTTNTAPIADAGPDQAVTVIGSTVQIDGSHSYDLDGDAIYYQWSSVSFPDGAALWEPAGNTVTFTFEPPVRGTYVFQLIVTDRWTQSAPDTVTISFENVQPVANAGTSQSAVVGDTVTLNGSGSSDANGDPLTNQWSLTSVPAGSLSAIASPTAAVATFVPDLPGTYVAQLIVNDGFVNSDPSTIQVQVVTAQTEAVQQTQNIQTTITSLDTSVLKNTTMQNALSNKLNAVLASIAGGNYAAALNQLQNDILLKTDGCAKYGAPDKNDWINTCPEQEQVYSYIVQLIQLLKSMM